MGTEVKCEVRSRARTISNNTMEENVQLLPTMPLPSPEMIVYGSDPKPAKLSLIKILLLNAVVCGVEICACSGFTYIPPMLLKSGYTEENMSIILGLGPLLGFLLVPMIGRASDRCRSRIGRRRPFILGLSSLLMTSLLIIPYNDKICEYIFGPGTVAKSFSLLLLTSGVVLLDFTSQACLTPCEALLSDISRETGQQQRVFIVYSLMVSTGGFLGYLVTAIDWKSTKIGIYFRTQERTVFSILTMLFCVLLLATILAAKEKQIFMKESEGPPTDTLLEISSNGGESGYDTNGSENGNVMTDLEPQEQKERTSERSPFKYNAKRTAFSRVLSLPKSWLRFFLTFRFLNATVNLLHLVWVSVYEKLPEPFQRLCDIPHVLRHLALAHFCSWTAIMGFNLFFTDFVGNAVYEGNPNAPEDSYMRNRFDEGVRMGSWGLLLHCITSAVYALFVEKLVSRFGCKLTYTFGMTSFIFAMFGMVLVQNVIFVNLMAALTGFAYATVLTIPFILVSKYHSEKEVYFSDVMPKVKSPLTPAPVRGIATDIATLDSAYFLSQVILSCLMGYIVYMTGSVLSYMVTAGVMGVLSIYFIQNIVTCEQEMTSRKPSLHAVL